MSAITSASISTSNTAVEAESAAAVAQVSTSLGKGEDPNRKGSFTELAHESSAAATHALARELDAPVVLHVLGAHGPALDTMRRDGLPAAGGMVHSYSGSAELVSRYEDLGLYVSFSGSVTRPTARKVKAAAAAVVVSYGEGEDQPKSGKP